ncbi:DMT family transporter [Streptomyces sp. WMMB 714]|uniref:DMT family transporter n=1 Tax=Streptomyces sp. WMMB 714 TaxID=1286822 RepID=UPI00094597D2|nr:DMT family transporter [Streptomyces sp. WMMB 714]
MRDNDSAIGSQGVAVPPRGADVDAKGAQPRHHLAAPAPAVRTAPGAPRAGGGGLLLAALGVVCFSLTFPATAWTLEGFGPWSATFLRLLLAAVLASVLVAVLRVPVPARRHWPWLAVAASGVMVGFPLLTTLALQTSTTAHAAVVVGLLPLTTALYSSLRTGARPSRVFWGAALAGAAAVIAFAVHESGGAPTTGDLFLGVALLLCAAGYAEGARLVGELTGTQVVGWALVGCLPLAVPGAAVALALEPSGGPTVHAVLGLLWVAAGSQLLGLTLWYRGLSVAGVARASQTQLAQPLLTLGWSVLLLGEELSAAAPLTAVAVLVCIAVVRRSRT